MSVHMNDCMVINSCYHTVVVLYGVYNHQILFSRGGTCSFSPCPSPILTTVRRDPPVVSIASMHMTRSTNLEISIRAPEP